MSRPPQIRRTSRIGLALIVAGAASGCLGPKVLSDRTDHTPAPQPNVELLLKSTEPADVLVVYDEKVRKSPEIHRRAFFLFANQERLLKGKKPSFVAHNDHQNLSPIPIFHRRPDQTQVAELEMYAVSTLPLMFELRSRDRVLAEFKLPEFGDWWTTRKVLLFPLAVAADAVGAGAAAGAVVGAEFVRSGGTIEP